MNAIASSLVSLRIGERPRWVRPLLAIGAVVFIGRLTGAFQVSDSLFAVAIAVEIVVVSIEVAITVAVIRHFYVQHRDSGLDRSNAYIEAELDELRATGLPENLVLLIGRGLRFEMRVYRAIARFLFRRGE